MQSNTQSHMIRIYVVDDHPIVQGGLSFLTNHEKDIKMIGSAVSGEQAVSEIQKMDEKPDVVLMDISLSNGKDDKIDGIVASQRIKRISSDIKILVFSTGVQRGYVKKVVDIGVEGYVVKNSDYTELINAIRILHGGNTYFGKEAQDQLMKIIQQRSNNNSAYGLTPRELDILEAIGKGMTSEEISKKNFISINTVHTHRRSLHAKLEVKNAIDLVNKARSEGLID